jgi:hypothetical protein
MLEGVRLALALWCPHHAYSSVARGELVLASSLFEPSPDLYLYPQLVSAVSLVRDFLYSLFLCMRRITLSEDPSHPSFFFSLCLVGWSLFFNRVGSASTVVAVPS